MNQMNLEQKLKFYLDNNQNVLLVGEHGTGKSTIIKELFDSQNLNYKYFSGPTMDPWINFVGVPKEVNGKLEFILPPDFDDDTVEAIFIDELNRAHTQVRNAVLELVQFKSMNGRKFNNLKVVWAAINPDESDKYQVERLCPVLKDRFQIQINVDSSPNESYFCNKYNLQGKRAVEWWFSLPSSTQKEMVSPRRLEYAINILNMGGDVADVFPRDINSANFVKVVRAGSHYERFLNLKTDLEKINDVNSNFEDVKKEIYAEPSKALEYIKYIDDERLLSVINDKDQLILTSMMSTSTTNDVIMSIILDCIQKNYESDLNEKEKLEGVILELFAKTVNVNDSDFVSDPNNDEFQSLCKSFTTQQKDLSKANEACLSKMNSNDLESKSEDRLNMLNELIDLDKKVVYEGENIHTFNILTFLITTKPSTFVKESADKTAIILNVLFGNNIREKIKNYTMLTTYLKFSNKLGLFDYA